MRKTMIALLGASAVLVSGDAFAAICSTTAPGATPSVTTPAQPSSPDSTSTTASEATLSVTSCSFVMEEQVPAAKIDGEIVVGQALPETVELHSIPDTDVYVFANVNDKRVLVEPSSRKVVEIVELDAGKQASNTEPMDADKSAANTEPMDADKSASAIEPQPAPMTAAPPAPPEAPAAVATDTPTTTTTAPTTTTTARPEGLQAAEADKISAETLLNTTVYGANDESLGEVGDVILAKDAPEGKIDAVVIDVGGFLGLGEKPVAISFDDLEIMVDEGGTYYVYTKFTQDQLEAATEYDAETFEQNRDRMILRSQG
jgi:hypothetical protein